MLVAAGVAKSATTMVTYQVSASADDGYAWSATEQDTASGYLMIGDDRTYTAPYYMSAMRFTNVAIPRSATIIDAHLKISSINEGYRGQIYGVIQAETADDAIDFSSRYIGAIGKTTAATDWDHKDAWAANTYYTSPDISSVIQEVVNRPGFGSGNSIAIYYSTRDLSGKARSFASYEYSPASAAGLEITYEYYTISGTVKTNRGVPLEGVQIDAGSDIESTVTDASGYYELYVPVGWSGQVKATNSTAWGFNIKTQLYTNVTTNQVNQNFTIFYPSISGTVMKEDGTPLAGATVTIDSVGSSYITDANGYYEIAVPYHWYGTVSANLVGYYFINKSYTHVTTDQTNQNFTAFQPKISGYVKDGTGSGVEGVQVSADNGGGSDITNLNGYYRLTVPYDWSGIVEVSKDGWRFSPLSMTYMNVTANQTSQNYTGFQPKISGYINDANGVGLEGVTVSADNSDDSDISDASGYYEIVVPYDWSGTVTPKRLRWGITPSNRSYNNVVADQFNQDFLAVYIGIITVKADGSGDFTTIQDAIDIAGEGDIIIVHPGRYYENITFPGIDITLTSIDPNDPNIIDATIIDANHSGTVVTFNGSESEECLLTGITITNGLSTQGGGIKGNYSFAQVRNSIITGNKAYDDDYFVFGGGIYKLNGNITNCVISENETYFRLQGGGAYSNAGAGLAYCNGEIRNCTISNNSALSNWPFNTSGGGLYMCSGIISRCIIINNNSVHRGGGLAVCYGSIDNCLIANNSAKEGGGFHQYEGIISNCTITNNSATEEGGGIRNKLVDATIENCIFWGNVAVTHSQVLNPSTPRYNCIQDWTAGGVGNISLNPLFTDDGYHITTNSPCLDAGDPNTITEPNVTDIDGNPRMMGRIDIGADEFFPPNSGLLYLQSKDYDFQVLGLDPNTLPQFLRIYNYGGLGFDWHIELPNDCGWLNISTLSGHTASFQMSELSIDIDFNSIDYGFHNCQFQVVAPDAIDSPQTVSVNLNVLGPTIQAVPQSFLFERLPGDINIVEDVLYIDNSGLYTLNWQIEVPNDCNWLSVEPTNGQVMTEPNEVVISANPEGLGLGIYSTQLTILALDANNSPQIIPVTLHIHRPGQRHVPGEYATIQAAIDAAFHLEEVIIEPGRYTGPGNCDIYFRGKAITIRSVEPNNPAVVAATIIEPNTLFANGFNFRQSERVDSVIDGLTIRRCISWAAIDCYYDSSPTIRNCIIEDNYSYDSGRFGGVGIACYESSPVISNCVIRNNDGSGLWSRRSEPTVRNCTFTGNRGSYHHDYYGETSLGGGILCEGGNISVINCTFSGNIADVGGGICSFGNYAYINNVTISNCIFWDNDANDGPQIALNLDNRGNPSTVSVSYSDVQGGEAAVYVDPCCTLDWDDDNNLDIDPCFAVLGYWHTNDTPEDINDDFWVSGDYHLRSQSGCWDSNSESWYIDASTSPCIDAGDPNSDWSRELWPHGRRINMGAYGGTPEASMSLSDAGNIASLNGDDSVGYADIILFIEKWLYEEVLLPEDFDRNGIVNFIDFAIFADNWEGTPCQAGNPNPADGETRVDPNDDLSWTAGYGATSHDVYFGTTDPPPFIRNQTATTFDPGTMDSSTVYYWRIDEVNSGGRTTGEVWTFGPPPPPQPPPMPPPYP